MKKKKKLLDVNNTVIKIIYQNKIIINYYIKKCIKYIPQKSKLKLDGDLNFSLLK